MKMMNARNMPEELREKLNRAEELMEKQQSESKFDAMLTGQKKSCFHCGNVVQGRDEHLLTVCPRCKVATYCRSTCTIHAIRPTISQVLLFLVENHIAIIFG